MKKQTKLGLVLAAAAVISVSVASLVSARGWVQQGADWYYVDNNNEYVTDTIQSSGNAKFYLGEDGTMQRDYFLEDYNENAYYFGNNGAMVTNTWVAIESSRVENQDDYVPDNYWYYFQSSGKALKSSSGIKKTTIDGKKYAFNQYGQMLTGWFGEDGVVINPDDDSNPFSSAVYYAGGDNDGILRAGWLTYYDGYDGGDDDPQTDYTNLYFYFNTSNNKKYGYDGFAYKKINGRNYAFNNEGIMFSGWDVYDNAEDWSDLADKVTYFSTEDDGHQVKKGWVYAVPSEKIDSKKHDDDEEVYMYFSGSGDIVKDQFKKINGKYYAFNHKGVMKTGIVIWCPAGVSNNTDGWHYVDTIDLDYANGDDVTKKGWLQVSSNEWIRVNPYGEMLAIKENKLANEDAYTANGLKADDIIKLHLHGSDGARRTGQNSVEFNDNTYVFQSNGSGNKESGTFSKKYYVLGFQLKASQEVRYGIYNTATWGETGDNAFKGPFQAQSSTGKLKDGAKEYFRNLVNDNYIVLTTGGAKQKGSNGSKKDADGNYWLISKEHDGALKGIWTVEVHEAKSLSSGFTTKTVKNNGLAKNRAKYRGSDLIGTLSDLQIAVDVKNPKFNALSFTAYVNSLNDTVYFQTTTAYDSGLAFKADYGDKSNKWIPAGLLDNSNKTISINLTEENIPEQATQYLVTPTNDYFLNCYWYDKKFPDGKDDNSFTSAK